MAELHLAENSLKSLIQNETTDNFCCRWSFDLGLKDKKPYIMDMLWCVPQLLTELSISSGTLTMPTTTAGHAAFNHT